MSKTIGALFERMRALNEHSLSPHRNTKHRPLCSRLSNKAKVTPLPSTPGFKYQDWGWFLKPVEVNLGNVLPNYLVIHKAGAMAISMVMIKWKGEMP